MRFRMLPLLCMAVLSMTSFSTPGSAAPPRGRKPPAAPTQPTVVAPPPEPARTELRPRDVDRAWTVFSLQVELAAKRESIERTASGFASLGASVGLVTGGALAMDNNEDWVTVKDRP